MITSYDQMPIGIYIKLLEVIEDKDRSELDKQVGLVALLAGMTEQQVLDLPVPDFAELSHQLAFLQEPAPSADIPDTLPERVNLGGLELEVIRSVEEINTAQYVDYQQLAPQGRAGIPGIVALMLVPPGKVYGHNGKSDPLAYDAEAVRQAVANHLTVTEANRYAGFFLREWGASLKRSLTSLRQAAGENPTAETVIRLAQLERLQEEVDSWSSGAGLTP